MHTCVRCGREAGSIGEIHNGCPCGSKVFVFNKDTAGQAAAQAGQAAPLPENATAPIPVAGGAENPGKEGAAGGSADGDINDGKAPESSSARTTFSSEDVENIKIVSEGVFFVDVNALSKNPVVLKDEEGVYYVRLPLSGPDFEEGRKGSEGDGKKAEDKAKTAVAEEKEAKK